MPPFASSAAAASSASVAAPPTPAAAAATFPAISPAVAAALHSAAAAAPPAVVTLASASSHAIIPPISPHAALPSLLAPAAEASVASILASALPPSLGLVFPPAGPPLDPVAAFRLPLQPGLVYPAPSDSERITPTRLLPPLSAAAAAGTRRRKAPYASIPASQVGAPVCNHPIITLAEDADAVHANGQRNRGYKCSFGDYPSAVAHTLKHFATHEPPAGLCMNCFLFHDGTACASPAYDWSSHLGRDHPACPQCHRLHFPPCTPPRLH